MYWGRKWLVDFNAGKTQLILFERSNNTGAIDMEMNRSVLKGKLHFKVHGLSFSSRLVRGLLSLLLRLPSIKLESLFFL